MARKTTKLGKYEALEAKKMMTGDLGLDVVAEYEPQAGVFAKLDGYDGFTSHHDDTSTNGDPLPTEEVAFYYNRIPFGGHANAGDKVVDGADFSIWRSKVAASETPTSTDSLAAEQSDEALRAIFVKIPPIDGEIADGADGTGKQTSHRNFIADSFSFGVEREMKESGEKGGTEDINIGVGELQECTVSKSMDSATADRVFATST